MKGKTKSILIIAIKALLSISVIGLDAFFLYRFDYLNNFLAIDNILGILPLCFMILFTVAVGFLIWKKHSKSNKTLTFIFLGWSVVSIALLPVSVTKNWFFGKEIITDGNDGDINPYKPFMEGTKAVKLNEPSTLIIDSDMPVLDGALALYPVYSAVAQTIYNEINYNDEVQFRNTIRGYTALLDGNADIFFGAKPSTAQLKEAEKRGLTVKLTPIGLEAFVFIVPNSNPINNLSKQQM